MRPTLLAVTFVADDPRRLATFWARLPGRSIIEAGDAPVVPGDRTQLDLRFGPAFGGRHLDVGRLPEEGHVVLADPGSQ